MFPRQRQTRLDTCSKTVVSTAVPANRNDNRHHCLISSRKPNSGRAQNPAPRTLSNNLPACVATFWQGDGPSGVDSGRQAPRLLPRYLPASASSVRHHHIVLAPTLHGGATGRTSSLTNHRSNVRLAISALHRLLAVSRHLLINHDSQVRPTDLPGLESPRWETCRVRVAAFSRRLKPSPPPESSPSF